MGLDGVLKIPLSLDQWVVYSYFRILFQPYITISMCATNFACLLCTVYTSMSLLGIFERIGACDTLESESIHRFIHLEVIPCLPDSSRQPLGRPGFTDLFPYQTSLLGFEAMRPAIVVYRKEPLAQRKVHRKPRFTFSKRKKHNNLQKSLWLNDVVPNFYSPLRVRPFPST